MVSVAVRSGQAVSGMSAINEYLQAGRDKIVGSGGSLQTCINRQKF